VFFAIIGCGAYLSSELRQNGWQLKQDNLRMKFLALNVDFSSLSPEPLYSRRHAHAGVKEG